MAWHGSDQLDQAAGRELAAYLDKPREVFGVAIREQVKQADPDTGNTAVVGYRDAHVFHCSLSIKADDGPLSEETWDVVARDFMDEMGFTEASGKAPCRWVAVHHGVSGNGNDHIHLAASMVREDGTRWEGRWRDYTTSQQVARRLEVKHGLTQVEGRAYETTERGDRFGERQAAGRAGLASTARDQLAEMVRSAAVGSRSEAEWVRRLRAGGVVVKPYFATGSTDVATGYKAALRPESYDDKLVFYGGGRLGRDLSLPRVRECWAEPSVEDAAAASVEWQAAFRGQPAVDRGGRETPDVSSVNVDRVIGRFARFNDQLAQVPVTDRTGWADAARDVSGTLSAWARLDPGNAGEFRTAAAALSRSAQTRRPGQAPTGGRSGSPTGAALLLLQAARQGEGGKAAVAGVLLLRQILRTAESLRRITPRPRTPRKQPGCNAT